MCVCARACVCVSIRRPWGEGFFRNAGVRVAVDDKDLPPPAYLRHDLGAELAFPELYGGGRVWEGPGVGGNWDGGSERDSHFA